MPSASQLTESLVEQGHRALRFLRLQVHSAGEGGGRGKGTNSVSVSGGAGALLKERAMVEIN